MTEILQISDQELTRWTPLKIENKRRLEIISSWRVMIDSTAHASTSLNFLYQLILFA
jgi:hypothetical protein